MQEVPSIPRVWMREELDNYPFIVIYKVTHACNLACIHCQAEAQPHPLEPHTHESLQQCDEIAELHPATLVQHRSEANSTAMRNNDPGFLAAQANVVHKHIAASNWE